MRYEAFGYSYYERWRDTNKSIARSLVSSPSFKAVFFLCCAVLIAALIVLGLRGTIGKPLTAQDLARDADRRADAMYDVYCGGSFSEALNALSNYINFLEANKDQLAGRRQIDSMLFFGHLRAGYMLLVTTNEGRAYYHLEAAYNYDRRHRLLQNLERVGRDAFVDFAVSNNTKLESRLPVVWKADVRMETNVLEGVKAKFRQSVPKPAA